MSDSVAAVVVAGGSGRRMGGVRKQFLHLAGEPVLAWAVRAFLDHPRVTRVVVVLPAEDAADPPDWLRSLPVELAAGGEERGDSVWNGLQLLPPDTTTVLVHDGARPFVSGSLIDRVLDRSGSGGAIAAVRVTDTIKQGDEAGRVVATLDRSRLWRAQTPQGFPFPALLQAYRRSREEGWPATDDAALCERAGLPVALVDGDPENLKITTPVDLAVAEVLARGLRDR